MTGHADVRAMKRLQRLLASRCSQAQRRMAVARTEYLVSLSRLAALDAALVDAKDALFHLQEWQLSRYFAAQRALEPLKAGYLGSIRDLERAQMRLDRSDRKLQTALRTATQNELAQVVQDWVPHKSK